MRGLFCFSLMSVYHYYCRFIDAVIGGGISGSPFFSGGQFPAAMDCGNCPPFICGGVTLNMYIYITPLINRRKLGSQTEPFQEKYQIVFGKI